MKKLTASHAQLFMQIAQTIAMHKRQVVGVQGNKQNPAFAYTIGNQEKGLPELLLIGNFDGGMVSQVLDRLSDRLVEQGKPFDNGALVSLGGKDNLAIWDATYEALRYTYQAGQFYGNEDYKVQQVVIPDRKGRFPEDPKCHKNWKVPVLKDVKLSS